MDNNSFNLDSFKKVCEEITDQYPQLLYDLSVTTLDKTNSRLNRQLQHGSQWDKDFSEMKQEVNSVIVWRIFSYVAADYFYAYEILPKVLSYLNDRFNSQGIWFGWDDYALDRKQYAMRSCAGKLSKPSIIFDKKFGLNCKLDLIFTNLKFEKYVVEKDSIYENCIGCDAPCESSCPANCRMNFKLIDWEKCKNTVDHGYLFANPHLMCRDCQDMCPFSEKLKNDILRDHPDCGGYMQDPAYYKSPSYSFGSKSF